jgi:FkbM family methyltransferase
MRGLMFLFFKLLGRIFRKIESFSGRGLGRIPGVSTLHRLWCSLYDLMYDKFKPKGIILINVQGNKMYVNTDDRGVVPILLMDGAMEKYDTELFKEMVKEGMIVVDIGANIGYYTLIAAKLVGKSGIVYAFEPEPITYELLCKNIEVNGYTNVVPIQKAVSNENGKTKIWCDKVNFASPSFSRENVLIFSEDNVLEDSFVEVETITLDEFMKNTVGNTKVDIMKVDAEGAEELIIDGAKQILESNNLKIIMEFWPLGLRNLGTDPLELLCKLQEFRLKIRFINEVKQALEPIEEIIKSCEKAWLPGGFNLLLEK